VSTNLQRGVTLVELVIVIAVLGITAATILGSVAAVAKAGGDNLAAQRAARVGAGYLEEILARSFADPDGVVGETVRGAFDDARDYDGLNDAGARDQRGLPLAGLEAFRIAVQVRPTNQLPGIPAVHALRIDVQVTDPTGARTVVGGYLTQR